MHNHVMISAPNPGTPDDDVTPDRRQGRIAARAGRPDADNPYIGMGRVEWYLGFYDVGLEKFFAHAGRTR